MRLICSGSRKENYFISFIHIFLYQFIILASICPVMTAAQSNRKGDVGKKCLLCENYAGNETQ